MSDDVRVEMTANGASGDLKLNKVSVAPSGQEVGEALILGAALLAVAAARAFGPERVAFWIGALVALRLLAAWRRRRRIVREVKDALRG